MAEIYAVTCACTAQKNDALSLCNNLLIYIFFFKLRDYNNEIAFDIQMKLLVNFQFFAVCLKNF